MKKQDKRSEESAKSTYESIAEMVKALEAEDNEQAQQAIQEDPLSVEVRSGWYTPGSEELNRKPLEFCILLGTGGPAVRIIGELTEHGEPDKATLQHQDWFTPWTDYSLDSEQTEILLTYCRQFYFGE